MKTKMRMNYKNMSVGTFLIFMILAVVSALFLYLSFDDDKVIIKYNEKGNNAYKVCLKENSDYPDECLKEGMQYIASLINYIDIPLQYNFKTNKDVDFLYNYKVDGKLVIYDRDNEENVLYFKDYELAPEKSDKKENTDSFTIESDVKIDYDQYNILAKDFKSRYNIVGEAKIVITLTVNTSIDYKGLDKSLTKTSTSSVSIPLTENTINIILNSSDLNENGQFVEDVKDTNTMLLVLGIISGILSLASLILTTYLLMNQNKGLSEYQKWIKYLKTKYGRLILEARNNSLVDEDKYEQIIDLKNFEELVDKATTGEEKNITMTYNTETKITWFTVDSGNTLYRIIYTTKDDRFQ